MENYKKKIKVNMAVFALVLVLAVRFFYLKFASGDYFGYSYTLGFFTGVLLIMGFYFYRGIRALMDEDYLRKLYIKDTDERKINIEEKSSFVSINLAISGLALASLVASRYNQLVHDTLVLSIAFIFLIRILSKFYYTRKL